MPKRTTLYGLFTKFVVHLLFSLTITVAAVGASDPKKERDSLSKKAKPVWDLLISETPNFSDGFGLLEAWVQPGFLEDPDFEDAPVVEVSRTSTFIERSMIGARYREQYWLTLHHRLLNETLPELSIPNDPFKEVIKSYYSLTASLKRTTRIASEKEAQSLALSEMRKRFKDFDQNSNDSIYRHEYLKAIAKYRESEIYSSSSSFANSFSEWKRLMIRRMKNLIIKNTLSAILRSAENNFVRLCLYDLATEGLSNIPITYEFLTRLSENDLELYPRPFKIPYSPFVTYAWVLKIAGKRIGVGTLSDYASSTNNHACPIHVASVEEMISCYRKEAPSDLPDLHLLLTDYISQMNDQLLELISLLEKSDPPPAFIISLSKIRNEFIKRVNDRDIESSYLSNYINPFGDDGDSTLNYIWWGFSQRPDYWLLRDLSPRGEKLNPFPFIWSCNYSPGEKSSFVEPSILKKSTNPFKFSNKAQPQNTPWSIVQKNKEQIVFSIEHTDTRVYPPVFFHLPYSEQVPDQVFNLKMVSSPTLTITSQPITAFREDLIFLPTPDNMIPNIITVYRKSGQELLYGKDYVVMTDSSNRLFAIKLTRRTRQKLMFHVGYSNKSVTKNIPQTILKINNLEHLSHIIELLKDAGFKALSVELSNLLQKSRRGNFEISLYEIAEAFENAARYSFVSTTASISGSESNPFRSLSRFLDSDGVFCTQCDGSNQLFMKFLRLLYQDNSEIEVINESGYIWKEGSQVTAADAHLITVIKWNGGQLIFDVTPKHTDPRNPAESQLENLMRLAMKKQPPREELLRQMEEDRQRLSNIPLVQSQVRRDNNIGNPIIVTLRLSNIARSLSLGDSGLTSIKIRLKELFPSIEHDYKTVSEAGTFVRARIKEVTSRLETAMSLDLNKELSGLHKAYANPAVQAALHDLLRSASRISSTSCHDLLMSMQ